MPEKSSIAKKSGHEVLRLPPYHCELDAIELVWADIKNFVAKENTTRNLETVESCFERGDQSLQANFMEDVSNTSKELKRNTVKHTESWI